MKIFGYNFSVTKIDLSKEKKAQTVAVEGEIESEYEPAKKLYKNMIDTCRCRFIAAERLGEKDKSLTRLTSMSSAYLIVLTVIPYFLEISKSVEDRINLISVAVAIIILVSSLLQYSGSYSLNSEQFHRSGLEINELCRKLRADAKGIKKTEYIEYAEKYGSVLQKYSINHEFIDYIGLQIQRPQDYPWNGNFKIFKMGLGRWIVLNATNIFLFCVTISWIWVIFCYALGLNFIK